jgi:tetratricopeptide (TPR) repeat protein
MHIVLMLVLSTSPQQEWAPYAQSRPAPGAADNRARYNEAVQRIGERQYGEATAILNELAVKEPHWAELFSARCSAQLGLNRPDSAAADCRYALQLKPGLVVALYGLATAERGLGQNPQAAAHFRQYASSTSPDATADLKASAAQQAVLLAPEAGPPAPSGGAQPAADQRVAAAGVAAHRGVVRTACQSNLDCGPGYCTDRGDGNKVCLSNVGAGSLCEGSIDCSGALSCKDRGDGLKACMR